MNKKDKLNEQLEKIIESYCDTPSNSTMLEFYRCDMQPMIEEIKASVKKAVVEALND